MVAVECIFTWYWLADLRAQEGIAFVLGHALDSYERLKTIPGIGKVLGLTILCEILEHPREPIRPGARETCAS